MEARRIELIKELMDSSLSDTQHEQKQSELETIENDQKMMREEDAPWDEVEVPMGPIKRQIAQQFVRAWKINKAMYEQYGGRIIFQQAGVEPLDAYRQFLKEQEQKGSFEILDKQYEESFWQYFTNDAMHTFYSEDDGARFVNTPWWMMEEPPEE